MTKKCGQNELPFLVLIKKKTHKETYLLLNPNPDRGKVIVNAYAERSKR